MSSGCDAIGGAKLYVKINASQNYSFVPDRFGVAKSAISFFGASIFAPPAVYFSGDFTITFWTMISNINQPFSAVLDFGSQIFDNIAIHYTNTSFRFYVVNMTHYTYSDFLSSVQTNNWYHFAFTLQGTTARMYLNGMLVSWSLDYIIPRNVVRSSNYIGSSSWGYSSQATYDEIKIYNVALSPANISLDFSIGSNNCNFII